MLTEARLRSVAEVVTPTATECADLIECGSALCPSAGKRRDILGEAIRLLGAPRYLMADDRGLDRLDKAFPPSVLRAFGRHCQNAPGAFEGACGISVCRALPQDTAAGVDVYAAGVPDLLWNAGFEETGLAQAWAPYY